MYYINGKYLVQHIKEQRNSRTLKLGKFFIQKYFPQTAIAFNYVLLANGLQYTPKTLLAVDFSL